MNGSRHAATTPQVLQAWLHGRTGQDAGLGSAEPGMVGLVLRVAWMGRTSTDDQQDPVGSLLRQLRVSQAALPDGAVIVAHFYDVESGRKDLAARGSGSSVPIPIPRDGGVQELLDRAESPDPGFDAVICEQIDRIARRTYYGTLIEHRLHTAGIMLWAADERIPVGARAGLADPAAILTRRVKQGVAEWYALDMLQRARDGFETHTEQGYSVGKAPYGYRGHTVALQRGTTDTSTGATEVGANGAGGGHRGKGRDGARTKTTLRPHTVEAQVVRRVYQWRIGERLGYQAIADRLNIDPELNPPPTPPDPARAVGAWTASSVRDVLTQPKYTGHMVWNRRAMKTRNGAYNPMTDWVWSSQPTHDPLIDLDTYIAAQDVIKHRTRSRTAPGHNPHPQTKRSYRLRSYLFCELCGRRMFGKSRRQRSYYACAPKAGQRVPDGHPASLWIAEDTLLDALNTFLAHHVFGAYRSQLLDATMTERADTAATEHTQQVAATQTALADLDRRRTALVRALELADDLDPELLTDISHRRKELAAERTRLRERLDQLHTVELQRSNPGLLNLLPVGPCDLDALPEDIARRLFEALRLEIHYNKTDHRAQFRITLSSETLTTAHQVSTTAIGADHEISAVPATASSGPSATSGRFPSVWCPRQDSNLRHPL